MRVGVLTGGGDCPGLDAVIRATVRKGVRQYGFAFTGFRDGWRGVLDGDRVPLDVAAVRGILPRGGTMLGSSRTDPLGTADGVRRIKENLAAYGVDALIVIGGRDTLGVAARLTREYGISCVGVPVALDGDGSVTDRALGFDTVAGITTEAIGRLRATAGSPARVQVCEVTGRHADWAAAHVGAAGRTNVLLLPEERFDTDQVCSWVTSRSGEASALVVVVAEGAQPVGEVRPRAAGVRLAEEIEKRTGREARSTVLGPAQRGGAPSAHDRWLATRSGQHAIDAVRDGAYGRMVAPRGTDIVRVSMTEAAGAVGTARPGTTYEDAGGPRRLSPSS
ncbi:ATP-dependent 6-phosphofructokinase [Streptomyces sp. NPDC051569]|uniref:ATP-dependent 6-phosphofructokinase n=1 Tax=Streptomyces sp. NPDC051569 TaxID=3365661 RepID=UPI00379D6241